MSIYGYHLETGCRAYGKKDFEPAGDESYRSQYLEACSCLEQHGWLHYEISNWALTPADICRHNMGYWRRRAYLGFGPSAHSFRPPDLRAWNRKDIRVYLDAAEKNFSLIRQSERLSRTEIQAEKLMLGLRLARGVRKELVSFFLKSHTDETLHLLSQKRLLRFPRPGCLALGNQGFLLYDSIVERLTA